jgi:hypothetical protein
MHTAHNTPGEGAYPEEVLRAQRKLLRRRNVTGIGQTTSEATSRVIADCEKGDTSSGLAATLPDLGYIRRNVPIEEVARQLGLDIIGRMARCWRPEKHQHGDRTPSVGLHHRKNFAKCFVCDGRALSPLDLVMAVQNVELRVALRWICARYQIPHLPKGRHIKPQQRWSERYRAGTGSRLDLLVKSLVWASLTHSERSILAVLDAFSDADIVTISYRGIMRYAGVGSQSTVASALKRFENLRVLKREQRDGGDALRVCGSYRWTLDDPGFLRLAEETREREASEIQLERTLRAKERTKRKAALVLPVNTLSSHRSTINSDATPYVHRVPGDGEICLSHV